MHIHTVIICNYVYVIILIISIIIFNNTVYVTILKLKTVYNVKCYHVHKRI